MISLRVKNIYHVPSWLLFVLTSSQIAGKAKREKETWQTWIEEDREGNTSKRALSLVLFCHKIFHSCDGWQCLWQKNQTKTGQQSFLCFFSPSFCLYVSLSVLSSPLNKLETIKGPWEKCNTRKLSCIFSCHPSVHILIFKVLYTKSHALWIVWCAGYSQDGERKRVREGERKR